MQCKRYCGLYPGNPIHSQVTSHAAGKSGMFDHLNKSGKITFYQLHIESEITNGISHHLLFCATLILLVNKSFFEQTAKQPRPERLY